MQLLEVSGAVRHIYIYVIRQLKVNGCTVRSPLTGCQVISRRCDRFSRYSKWLDTFRTALVCDQV